MNKPLFKLSQLSLVLLLSACTNNTQMTNSAGTAIPASSAAVAVQDNVLLQQWQGPFGGVPAFDQMTLVLIKPAFAVAMSRHIKEIDAITSNPAKPTFDNTIAALEGSGRDIGRLFTYWGIWRSSMSSPEFRQIQGDMGPKLSAHRTKINQNQSLFDRVQSVYHSDEMKMLSGPQRRVVELTYQSFSQNGATLTPADKPRYADLNRQLSQLQTEFSNHVLADEEKYVLYLSKSQLGGLPETLINGAASTAKQLGKPGEYAITNTRSSVEPFLTYSTDRVLREQVWRGYHSRGDHGDVNDNNAIIGKILKLREQRVNLLGFENFAQWRIANRMAKTPERAIALLEKVWPEALKRVEEEVADMATIARKSGENITIEPWDYLYYGEKVRKDKYALDSNEVKQYLQLDNLREAMFYVAGRLFNFNFTALAEGKVPVYHPDVKVWEVTDKTSGEHIGLWYLDPFARPGKRSGAWANAYRSHELFEGKKTALISNNSNFIKGKAGDPVLVSWSDATTFFHEFGHALHGLSSNVAYPTLNGGVRDYTEFQSQLLERWLSTDEVTKNYLVHHKTGQPIPESLLNKIKKAATFNQGYKTTEYLASALIDMKVHTADPTNFDAKTFERETLAKLNMPDEIVMRHRMPHFGHIFAQESYSAGYYGYLWADVLTSDAAEAFAEAPGGFYDKEVSENLVKHLFSIRNSVDPAKAYQAFRGRDAKIGALMRDRGFAPSKN
ncbi:MAG: peptidyl-dipeptidase Dcp [Phenylobacterium sp.]|jgi:peptidyl-dipeptidase Dcp